MTAAPAGGSRPGFAAAAAALLGDQPDTTDKPSIVASAGTAPWDEPPPPWMPPPAPAAPADTSAPPPAAEPEPPALEIVDQTAPVPLGEVNSSGLPTFPVDALPDAMREIVVGLAEETQTDPALAGTVALATIATTTTGNVRVHVNGNWHEPLNLFTAPTAGSGERKSPVFAELVRPLHDAEKALVDAWKPKRAEAEISKQIANARAAEAMRSASKAKTTEDRREREAEAISEQAHAESIDLPPEPRIISDDATPEALAQMLGEHRGRAAILSAEGGGILGNLAGRFNNGVSNLDAFLKGYSGEPVRIDRKGHKSIHVPSANITVCVALQPILLDELVSNQEFRDRGVVPRFLFALCDNKIGARRIDSTPVPDHVRISWHRLVTDLAVDLHDADPITLTLDPDAAAIFHAYRTSLEPRLGPHGDLAHLTAWGGKAAGTMIRLAGILHVASTTALTRPITGPTMTAARDLIDYFTAHAIAAHQASDPVAVDARTILNRLHAKDHTTTSERDIHLLVRTGKKFSKAAELRDPIDHLVETGWLTPLPDDNTEPKTGRKKSPRYAVSPKSVSHNTQNGS